MTGRERNVFRVEKSQGFGLGVVMGGFGMVAGVTLSIKDGALFWGLVAAAAAVGYFIGHAAKNRRCSHCRERISRYAETCQGCGGVIKGAVANARELSAAEDALNKTKNGPAE
jgi:hypothetical protein